jgi:WD40 repeat protein
MLASLARFGAKVRVWDASTGKLLHEFDAAGLSSRSFFDRTLAFTPGGKAIAAGVEADICFFDLHSGREIRRFRGNGRRIVARTFSADGKTFYGGGADSKLYQWEVASGTLLRSWDYFEGRQQRIFSNGHAETTADLKAISPDGKTAVWYVQHWKEAGAGVVGEYEELRIWNLPERKDRYQLADRDGKTVVSSEVVLSSDGKYLTACSDPLRVWEVATGKTLWTRPSRGRIEAVAFSPDGRLVAALHKGNDSQVVVCDLLTGKELWHCEIPGLALQWSAEKSLAFSPNGTTLALAHWKNIAIWDTESGKERVSHEGHRWPIQRLAVSASDGTLISADSTSVCEWNTEFRQTARHDLSTYLNTSVSLAESCETNLRICRPAAGRPQLCELLANRLLGEFAGVKESYSYGCFSTDGRTAALMQPGEKSELLFLDVRSRTVRARLTTEIPLEGSLVLSRDGKLLAVSCPDQTVVLIDSYRGEIVRRLGTPQPLPRENQPQIELTEGAFSPDGELVAFGARVIRPGIRWVRFQDLLPDPPGLRVWRVATGRELRQFERCLHNASHAHIASLRFSPDSKSLAVALNFNPYHPGDPEEAALPVLETASGRLRRRFKGHTDQVDAVTFCSAGKVLASGSRDATILLWDMTRPLRFDPATARPAPERLHLHWRHLAGRDAEAAYDAVLALAALPEGSVAFLAGRLQPVEAPSQAQLARWIADLGAASFRLREEADAHLTAAHEMARPALKQALAGKLSVEARRRITELLAQLDAMTYPPALLQELRAVEVLERIATPAARQLLERVAAGAAEAVLTIEARASLARMNTPR